MNDIKNKDNLEKWLIINNPRGTYIFDKEILESDYNYLKSNIPKNAEIAYSYKTNSYKGICKSLNDLGALSEVVSPYEIELTKRYGINPKFVIYNGPIKDKNSVEYVLVNDGLVNIDSISDFHLVNSVVNELPNNKKYRVGIRLDLNIEETRFGINVTQDSFIFCLNKIINNQKIIFDCFHVHYPTRSKDSLRLRLEKILHILKKLDVKPNAIDIGGSFPSLLEPILSQQLNIDTFALKENLKEVCKFNKKLSDLNINKIVLEPGTALASNCFYLCGRVSALNKKGKDIIATLDISKLNLGNINSNLVFPFNVIRKKNINLDKKFNYKICGYTCIEKDIFCSKVLNEIELGDYLIFKSSGSYSYAFESFFINPPLEVLDLPKFN